MVPQCDSGRGGGSRVLTQGRLAFEWLTRSEGKHVYIHMAPGRRSNASRSLASTGHASNTATLVYVCGTTSKCHMSQPAPRFSHGQLTALKGRKLRIILPALCDLVACSGDLKMDLKGEE